jgi:hypothetical protein
MTSLWKLPFGTERELPPALSFRQQFPTKLHFFPLAPTIVKKKELRKPLFDVFPFVVKDLAGFSVKYFILNN